MLSHEDGSFENQNLCCGSHYDVSAEHQTRDYTDRQDNKNTFYAQKFGNLGLHV